VRSFEEEYLEFLLMFGNYGDTSSTCFDSMCPSPGRRDHCRVGTALSTNGTNGRGAKRQGLRHYILQSLMTKHQIEYHEQYLWGLIKGSVAPSVV
jgi:hypothetical protein